jgi:hypothetical protein
MNKGGDYSFDIDLEKLKTKLFLYLKEKCDDTE